jgi:hypothetical protein
MSPEWTVMSMALSMKSRLRVPVEYYSHEVQQANAYVAYSC